MARDAILAERASALETQRPTGVEAAVAHLAFPLVTVFAIGWAIHWMNTGTP